MVIWQMENEAEKEAISRRVLAALPAWFGIPEATEEYVQTSRNLPFWAAFEKTDISAGDALGFIVLKETSPATAEIYVMAFCLNGTETDLAVDCLRHCANMLKNRDIPFCR